jgi:hypothetical protein
MVGSGGIAARKLQETNQNQDTIGTEDKGDQTEEIHNRKGLELL